MRSAQEMTQSVWRQCSRRLVLWGVLALAALFFLAGCSRAKPTPPSRNVFYEVQVVSPTTDGAEPEPVASSAEALGIDLADEDVLSPSFEARWSIDWHCLSKRCQFEQCVGTARSTVRDVIDQRWLQIDRRITWNEGCGKRSSWLTQVDRYTGEERYPSQQDRLFNFWAGHRAGTPQRQIELADGRSVEAWCTGPQKAEVEEDDGWTTLYDGEVCYDVRTGMLVFMSYIKRWVFTGVYEGTEYEKAYFGDSETYEQLLESTNAELSFVTETNP